jgi:hypothetical protein
MRITVSHDKGKEEAMRIVDGALNQVLGPLFAGFIQMRDVEKQWQGNRLLFSLRAGLGVISVPVKGWILVTDTDITIDVDMPQVLEKLVPERCRSDVQGAIRGLLT